MTVPRQDRKLLGAAHARRRATLRRRTEIIDLNDARVLPWMSGKMAARMQAVTTSGNLVVIRVGSDAGHRIGSQCDQTFIATADAWSFFLAASGDPEFQPH